MYGSHGEVKQYNEVMKPGKVQKQRTLITKPNLSIPTKIMMPPASVRNRRQSSTTIDQALQGKGQLISKCSFGAIVWSKRPTKLFPGFLP